MSGEPKIFVSYKHSDGNVFPLHQGSESTARDYVNEIEDLLEETHIYKGEHDDEDLSQFKDSTIQSHLRDKIYDSSVTLVVISPHMKEFGVPESDQWIPWEVSYSLKEHSRNGRTSCTNAALAVVLPDREGSYSYYLEAKACCQSYCSLHKTDSLFYILKRNMFNAKSKTPIGCGEDHLVYAGEHSYMRSVKWDAFKNNPNASIERALRINDRIEDYEVEKQVEERK